jgi:hypothetical protein
MDDATLVRRLERLGDLTRNVEGFLKRQARGRLETGSRGLRATHGATRRRALSPRPGAVSLRDQLGERRPLDQLHDEGHGAAGLLEPVDLGDVRVIERREHPGFAFEAGEPIRVGGERLWQGLDRHLSAELRVEGAVDFAHAALSQRCEDFVGTQAGAGEEGHLGLVRSMMRQGPSAAPALSFVIVFPANRRLRSEPRPPLSIRHGGATARMGHEVHTHAQEEGWIRSRANDGTRAA